MLGKILITVGLFTFGLSSHAGPFWNQLMKDYKLDSAQQAFCYLPKDKQMSKGSNPHMKVRLASVSKLITTLWAIEKLKPDYQYETKLFLKGKHLHISGSLDPLYSDRKLFFLLSQLNNQGITELDKITFDDNVKVFTKAERYSGSIVRVSQNRTAQNIKDFWNTPEWNKLKAHYSSFIQNTPESILKQLQIITNLEELDLKVKEVSFSNNIPFEKDDTSVRVLQHLSPEIQRYLKIMNIVSNNYIADQVFNKLGGEKKFDTFVSELLKDDLKNYNEVRKGFGKDEASIKMYSGSGLNSVRDGKRVDNFATCHVIATLVKKIDEKMTEYDREIKNLVAVPGTDLGTFRRRLRSPRLNKTFVAKTGTLYHTSALAGRLSTGDGLVYFGVFNMVQGSKTNVRIVQNKMVDGLFNSFSGPKKFTYSPKFFIPANEPIIELKQ